MRVLLLLVVVAITGLALSRWLEHPAPPPVAVAETQGRFTAPAVPTRPQDVKAFSEDLDRFIQDASAHRARQEPDQ